MFCDQLLVSVPDNLQIHELGPFRARGGVGGILFQFLRGNIAVPQLVQCLANPFHSARKVRHIPVKLQFISLFCHHPVNRHCPAQLVQGVFDACAGLLPYLPSQFPGTDDLNFQQSRQVQSGNQVPLCLQGILFRYIKNQPAAGTSALLRGMEHLRPYGSAAASDDLHTAHADPSDCLPAVDYTLCRSGVQALAIVCRI